MSKTPKYIYLFYIIGGVTNIDLLEWLNYDKLQSDSVTILKDTEEEDAENEGIYLYAFTTSKRMAKEFQRTRNSKKFIMIMKNFDECFGTEEEFEKFQRKYRHNVIKEEKLSTRNYSPKINCGSVDISLCVTQFESEYINTSFEGLDDRYYVAFEQLSNTDIVFGCLTEKVKKNLQQIGFVRFIRFLQTLYGSTNEEVDTACLDEVQILFNYFGELFIEGEQSE